VHMVPAGHSDFRAYYTAGYMLRTGKQIYDPAAQLEAQNRLVSREEIALPFIHPAYEALIYVPFSFLSYLSAYWVWFALNLAMLASIGYILRAELSPLSAAARWMPAALLAAYMPFGGALVQGQDALLFTLLFVLAFALLRTEETKSLFLSGLLMGLCVYRFQLVLPVAVCFLCWRRWKLVAGLLCSAIPAALVSIAIGGVKPYLHVLTEYAGRGSDRAAMIEPAELHRLVMVMPNLRGLIQSIGGSPWLIGAASVLLLAVAILAGRNLAPQRQLALAVSAATLVSYYGLGHDLSVLIIPCAMLVAERTDRALLVVGVVFCSQALLIFAFAHFYLAALGVLVLFAYLGRTSFTPSARSFSTENALPRVA